jgi:hypothetical protein
MFLDTDPVFYLYVVVSLITAIVSSYVNRLKQTWNYSRKVLSAEYCPP